MTQPSAKDATRPAPAIPRINVKDLLQGSRQAVLVHDGTEYRLRLTSEGKMLLTK